MNARPYIKPEFAAMYPENAKFYHDGNGIVTVMFLDAVVTIQAANNGTS